MINSIRVSGKMGSDMVGVSKSGKMVLFIRVIEKMALQVAKED